LKHGAQPFVTRSESFNKYVNRENWEQVKDIFQAAVGRPIEERAQFLDAACQGDESLRREAEFLLSSFKTDFIQQTSNGEPKTDPNGDAAIKKPAPGARIGRYEIVRSLGAGGIGEVYLAEDALLKRQVALKFLSAQFVSDRHQLARFHLEAQAASALNHPNILTVYEIGSDSGVHFIVTEFIDGKTLRETLKTDELPLRKLLPIAVQTAEALSAAHSAGILHRDIKPENVMIRRDGYVKVLDFGLAKITEPRVATNATPDDVTRQLLKTKPGTIMGTVAYMSPEQTRGLADVDARTDVWSLGVCLFEMIAGRTPFAGETVSDVIASILKTEPVSLTTLAPDCPPELERIVAKALQKDRDERYQVMKDLALDLKTLQRELDFSASGHRTTHENAHATVDAEQRKTTNALNFQRFSFLHIFSILLAIGLGIGVLWWLLAARDGDKTVEVSQLKTIEVVNWAAAPGEFYSIGTFSPDAKMIAFTSTRTGSRNVWIKQSGAAGEAVQITKDEFKNERPVWSPDGAELAFFSTRGNKPGIWRIPVLGGSPKLIAEIPDAASVLRSWSKKNSIYYESKNNLFAVDPNTGQSKQITNFDPKSVRARAISASPDERQISYITEQNKQWHVWVSSLNGDAPKNLLGSTTEIRNTAWHPDNQRVFYSALVDSTFQIFVVGVSGNPPKQLSFADLDCFVLDVSSDGAKILYGTAKEESDVWMVNLNDFSESVIASEIDSELWAAPAPDGRTLAYQSIRNLSQGNKLFSGSAILIKTLDTNESPVQLVAKGSMPVWSPDGKTIAFVQVAGEKYQLEAIRATGGEQKHLATELVSPENTLLPYNRTQTSDFSWSPDGSKIAYLSERNGLSNIFLVNADGSGDVQLTNNNDSNLNFKCPLWSSDGKRIAFTGKIKQTDGKTIYSVAVIDVETKTTKEALRRDSFVRLLGWSADGNELVLVSTPRSAIVGLHPEVSILQVEIGTGKSRELMSLTDVYLYNIHLSPDKKFVAFVAHRDGKDNIWLVSSNGIGEAKKATANNDSRFYFSTLAWSPDNKTVFFGKQSRYSLLSMLTNFK
jgi:eukaryotic-like serine/threonine-protein kinase